MLKNVKNHLNQTILRKICSTEEEEEEQKKSFFISFYLSSSFQLE